MCFRYVCKLGAHNVAILAAHWSHIFDENPYAFQTFQPLREHALTTHFSISDAESNVHSAAAFDENPCAILRILNQHGNVNLPSWHVQNVHHDGRTKCKKYTFPLAKRV